MNYFALCECLKRLYCFFSSLYHQNFRRCHGVTVCKRVSLYEALIMIIRAVVEGCIELRQFLPYKTVTYQNLDCSIIVGMVVLLCMCCLCCKKCVVYVLYVLCVLCLCCVCVVHVLCLCCVCVVFMLCMILCMCLCVVIIFTCSLLQIV